MNIKRNLQSFERKSGQKACFLRPRSSKVIERKEKERRKRKNEDKERRRRKKVMVALLVLQ